jgi:hypothetical protein
MGTGYAGAKPAPVCELKQAKVWGLNNTVENIQQAMHNLFYDSPYLKGLPYDIENSIKHIKPW